MKIHKRFYLLIAFILCVTACDNKPKEFSTEKLDTEIAYWSSDKFEGREAGTKGNKAVREEIAKKFNEIGLEPLQENDYLLPFDFFYQPLDKANLVVHLKNEETMEFEYGTDWINSSNKSLDVELPIYFFEEGQDITQEINKGSIIVTSEVLREDVRVQLIKTDNLYKTVNHFTNSDSARFQITESVYDYLSSHKDEIEKIHLTWYKGMMQPTAEYNVAGKIPGSEGKQAIVISAHFDHVGIAGKTIFSGSLDNATGLTGMINLAELLTEDSKKQAYASDILFVGFNAEENGLIGSQHFVEYVQKQYDTIVNINLDCIGSKNGGDITFVGETSGSGTLNELLSEIAAAQQINTISDIEEISGLTSDHTSFLRAGYQAVNISQEKYANIHTPLDTPDNTDSEPLKKAIELVQEFVNKHHETAFELPTLEMSNGEAKDDFDESKYTKDLSFGEYKQVKGRLVFNLNRSATEEELVELQGAFSNSEYVIEDSKIIAHIPDNEIYNTIISITEEGKVGQLKKEDYEIHSINLLVTKNSRVYNLSIFSGDVISYSDPTNQKIGTWDLQPGRDTYGSAISTFEVDSVIRKALLQSYNEWTNTSNEPYTKEEITDFINSFDQEKVINFLLKLNEKNHES